ncbi:hypothetical protein ACLOJK_019492 [Asimina triloba]
MVLDDGTILNSAEEVHLVAAQYFRNFLSTSVEVEQGNLSSILAHVITEEDNKMLCLEPTEMEVKDALSSITQHTPPPPPPPDKLCKKDTSRRREELGCMVDQERYSAWMPWIGLYIAAASVACSVAMMVDYVQGFRHRKVAAWLIALECGYPWEVLGCNGLSQIRSQLFLHP